MDPEYPSPTVPCYALDDAGGNTYLPPAQPVRYPFHIISCSLKDIVCEGERVCRTSLQGQPSASFLLWSQPGKAEGLVGESHSFGDSVQYISEPSQAVYPSTPYAPNNATSEMELGLARVGDAYTVVPHNAVQVVNRVYESRYGTGGPANETQHTSCPLARCRYTGVEGTPCLQEISCATVPTHFASHGIKNKSRKEVIHCKWKGCDKAISRHTFVCSSSGPMIITKTIKSSTNLAKAHSLRHSQVLLSQSKPQKSQKQQQPATDVTTTTTPTTPVEAFMPRKYQEEIFIRAQSSNIIAALDTGSGKTYISVLLIKWIVLQPHVRGKVVVFLVPKVALVEQQAAFITSQTPLRVRKFHGRLDLELSDRANWKAAFEGADVVVMTAQIFLNVLTHSHWSIDRVSLIIFDECHHTRKNHAYNGIMREYFQIFGMTASPTWNPKDAEGSLQTLERNLDATVIAVREHVSELLANSPRPVEDTLSYFHSDDVDIPWDKLLMKYHVTRNSLGPYCADLFIYHDLRPRISQILYQIETTWKEQLGDPLALYDEENYGITPMDVDGAVNMPKPPVPVDLEQIDAILTDFQPCSLAWCSPKVKALTEVLLEYYTSTFHGIVFVEQRQVAACNSLGVKSRSSSRGGDGGGEGVSGLVSLGGMIPNLRRASLLATAFQMTCERTTNYPQFRVFVWVHRHGSSGLVMSALEYGAEGLWH
ncbi:hypothetical protein EDC04DRAFT_2609659 [Pisolithus marmoratus]|nr:hypothetical protein EDC04DRAFT_2609659 [Pisolithus marmoratus]